MKRSALTTIFPAMALILAMADLPAGADIVFQEDFEDPDLEARGWYDFASPLPIVTDEAYDGTHSLAQTLEVGDLSQYGMRLEIPDMEVVYLRFARKFPTTWIWPSVNYGPHDFLLFCDAERWQTPTDTFLTLYVEEVDQGRAILILKDALQGYNFGTWGTEYRGEDVVFTLGEWHVVDAMIRLNDPGTANGEIRMWVDGALQVEETGIEMRFEGYTGISFNQLFYGFYYHEGSPIEQTFWTDHIIVADAPLDGPLPDDDGTEPVPDLPPDAPADAPPDAAPDASPDAAVDPGVDTPADMAADSPPPDGSDDPGADEDGEGCGCAVVS
jgi:hypothetical protein